MPSFNIDFFLKVFKANVLNVKEQLRRYIAIKNLLSFNEK